MSWLSKLYEAYDVIVASEERKGSEPTLLPVLHIMQGAHVEISLDRDGNFRAAAAIPKEEKQTVVPVTYRSKGRTNTAPHALFDSLYYLAGNLPRYLEGKARQKAIQCQNLYFSQLDEWAAICTHPMLQAIRAYLKKNTLISDLIKEKVLLSDASGLPILDKKDVPEEAEPIPGVYKTELTDIAKAFVRFSVTGTDYGNDRAYRNRDLQNEWVKFYSEKLVREQILYRGRCAVTGEETACTRLHAKNLRFSGDGARLISANDQSVVTYRGRFMRPEEVVNVGFEVSEKAHNALIWLIKNQSAARKYGLTVVAFTANTTLNPFDDDLEESDTSPTTGAEYANQLKKRFDGYVDALKTEGGNTGLQILVLSAATKGRMSVNLYREFDAAEKYFDNLLYFHRSIAWEGMLRNKNRAFASPPIWMILNAVYESRDSRDYLFGRLLAVAEQMESTVLYKRNEQRETAAERYFRSFFAKPVSTWRQINLALSNYASKQNLSFYERELDTIMSKLDPDTMTAKWDRPLGTEALIGYYQQRQKYFQKKEFKTDTSSETETENESTGE